MSLPAYSSVPHLLPITLRMKFTRSFLTQFLPASLPSSSPIFSLTPLHSRRGFLFLSTSGLGTHCTRCLGLPSPDIPMGDFFPLFNAVCLERPLSPSPTVGKVTLSPFFIIFFSFKILSPDEIFICLPLVTETVKCLFFSLLTELYFLCGKIYPAGIIFPFQPPLKVGVASTFYILHMGQGFREGSLKGPDLVGRHLLLHFPFSLSSCQTVKGMALWQPFWNTRCSERWKPHAKNGRSERLAESVLPMTLQSHPMSFELPTPRFILCEGNQTSNLLQLILFGFSAILNQAYS